MKGTSTLIADWCFECEIMMTANSLDSRLDTFGVCLRGVCPRQGFVIENPPSRNVLIERAYCIFQISLYCLNREITFKHTFTCILSLFPPSNSHEPLIWIPWHDLVCWFAAIIRKQKFNLLSLSNENGSMKEFKMFFIRTFDMSDFGLDLHYLLIGIER